MSLFDIPLFECKQHLLTFILTSPPHPISSLFPSLFHHMRYSLHLKPACPSTRCLRLPSLYSWAVSPLISGVSERIRSKWLGSRQQRYCCCRISLAVLELVLLSTSKLWRTVEAISRVVVLICYHQPELVFFPLPWLPSTAAAGQLSLFLNGCSNIWRTQAQRSHLVHCHLLWPRPVRLGLIRPSEGLLRWSMWAA